MNKKQKNLFVFIKAATFTILLETKKKAILWINIFIYAHKLPTNQISANYLHILSNYWAESVFIYLAKVTLPQIKFQVLLLIHHIQIKSAIFLHLNSSNWVETVFLFLVTVTLTLTQNLIPSFMQACYIQSFRKIGLFQRNLLTRNPLFNFCLENICVLKVNILVACNTLNKS